MVLEYYQEPLLDDGNQTVDGRQEPAGSIILFRDLWRFEMRVLDSRTLELISDWDIRGRLPLQVELNAVFDPEGDEVVHHFWIPTKTSPATLVQGLEQGANQNSARTGGQNNQDNSNTGDDGAAVTTPEGATNGGP